MRSARLLPSELGFATPEGWLCTSSKAGLLVTWAALKTSVMSTWQEETDHPFRTR
jgi:hypothetical protein